MDFPPVGTTYLADGWTAFGRTGPFDGAVTFEELGFFIKSPASIMDWNNRQVGVKGFEDGDDFFPTEPIIFTADMWKPEFFKSKDFIDLKRKVVPLPGVMLLLLGSD